jgi:SSS family transporter
MLLLFGFLAGYPASAATDLSSQSSFNPVVPTTSVIERVVAPGEDQISPHSESPVYHRKGLSSVDYLVLGGYFAFLLLLGFHFSKREKTTDDYFRGGKRVVWYAAGLSIVATKLSAISYMSLPAKSFDTNWLYILLPVGNLAAAWFVVKLVIPFYCRLNITTVYEYLESRFNLSVRIVGSLSFLVYEIARMGILFLLPSIALAVVTDLNIFACIAIMGVIATLYTIMGGVEAVIWTDFTQVLVMMGGALLVILIVVCKVPGGAPEMLATAAEAGKLKAFDWNLDLTTATVWVFVLHWVGGFKNYIANQTLVQRYISTRDEKQAARSVWLAGFMGVITSWLLIAVGTAIYGYYRAFPDRVNTQMERPDEIFPTFIVNEMPAGIAGLLIAAIFSAAMSSLDSAINSSSAVIVTDLHRRLRPPITERAYLRLSRVLTALLGLFGTGVALFLATFEIRSLFDKTMEFFGLFGGGLGGIFLLGILTTRASSSGVLIGFFASSVIQYFVKMHTPLHVFVYIFTGMASCYLIGYAASLVLPRERKSLDGLTVHTATSQSS